MSTCFKEVEAFLQRFSDPLTLEGNNSQLLFAVLTGDVKIMAPATGTFPGRSTIDLLFGT